MSYEDSGDVGYWALPSFNKQLQVTSRDIAPSIRPVGVGPITTRIRVGTTSRRGRGAISSTSDAARNLSVFRHWGMVKRTTPVFRSSVMSRRLLDSHTIEGYGARVTARAAKSQADHLTAFIALAEPSWADAVLAFRVMQSAYPIFVSFASLPHRLLQRERSVAEW